MSIFMLWGRRMLCTSLWRWTNRRRADSFFSGNYIPHMDRVSAEWKSGEGDYAYIRIEERKRKLNIPFLIFKVVLLTWNTLGNIIHRNVVSLCCVLSGLTAAWCNLTQLACACGRPACRTGLESWAGVQTHRNYHLAWFSSPVWQSLWESCFTWWSRPSRCLLFCHHHCWRFQILHPGVFAELLG